MFDSEASEATQARAPKRTPVIAARGELDEGKRKKIYHDLAVIMRDEGGLMVPFFNDFIDARSEKVAGYIKHPQAEMMDGYALAECWLQS